MGSGQSSKKIALLLKTVFLEGQSRYNMFQDREYPLKAMYQFSKRIDMVKNGEGTGGRGMLAFAWFVWDKEYTGEPTIKWIK